MTVKGEGERWYSDDKPRAVSEPDAAAGARGGGGGGGNSTGPQFGQETEEEWLENEPEFERERRNEVEPAAAAEDPAAGAAVAEAEEAEAPDDEDGSPRCCCGCGAPERAVMISDCPRCRTGIGMDPAAEFGERGAKDAEAERGGAANVLRLLLLRLCERVVPPLGRGLLFCDEGREDDDEAAAASAAPRAEFGAEPPVAR